MFKEILLSSYLLDFVKYQIKLRVTNSKYKLLFFYFGVTNLKLVEKQKVALRVTNLKLESIKFHFELLTRWLNFYFFAFKLLTRS